MNDSGWEITVLHVDDDPAFGELVATYLEREGGETGLDVVTVSDATAALDELERGRGEIDCVVSDYEMPEMSGLDLLSAVRSEWPDLPFVLLTGKGSEEVARDAFREGATDYVQKQSGADHYAVVANRIVNAVTQYRAQRTSRRYGSALEALDSAVFLLDDDGRFISVDDLFVTHAGAERRELLGRHVSALGTDDQLTAEFESISAESGPETTCFRTTLGGDEPTEYVVRMTRSGLEADTRGVVGTLSRAVEAGDPHADDLQYLVDFQDLVLDTSTSLMSAETDEIATKVRWTLQNVAEFADLDRCYIYETDGTEPPVLKHGWTRGEDDDAVAVPPEIVEYWEPEGWLPSRLCRFENVRIVDVADLPTNEAFTSELFAGTTGAVVVPLVSGWEFRGFVGFETARGPRDWSDAEVSMLRTVADTVAHTLERQRRERTLKRQNDRLDAFAAAVSHDLRNPLNVVEGFVDVAQETGDVSHLDRVSSAIDRMEAIIDDVLALAREGRTVGEVTTVDLTEVAEEAWLAVETADATLSVEEIGTVSADPTRLPAVFENLFRNSVEHGSTTGRSATNEPGGAGDTTVRIGPLDGASGFFVEDDGPGIPPDEHDQVFDEGYSTGDDGSGLGLAIVAKVVDAHGWSVDVTSGSDGGARFEVVTAEVAGAERQSVAASAEVSD
ncbi:hybrid sensor histidine kinase/response regulator [Salinigranum marinum]|uniref:hybrid sensor histidine kinase/response regulator n=1 Tax=Salinigranum marinum TaxID=1515595 RepID=UPI002989E3B0|nr:response regulator [Salinigranum marinum]